MKAPLQLLLPWPASELWPNSRSHWARLARLRRLQREDAQLRAYIAGLLNMEYTSLHAALTFHPPTRRRFDLDNALAAMKAALDGIADITGVDDSRWQIAIARGTVQKGGGVLVRFREGAA